MLNHAFHRTGNRVGATAGEGVAGVGGKLTDFAGGHVQACGTRLQRTQHDAVARQNQAAQKFAAGIQCFHSDSGAHHDDHHGAWCPLGQHAVVGANHGNPSVRSQTGGVVIPIAQAGLGLTGHYPLRGHIPGIELFLQATFDGVGGHRTTQNLVGGQ